MGDGAEWVSQEPKLLVSLICKDEEGTNTTLALGLLLVSNGVLALMSRLS